MTKPPLRVRTFFASLTMPPTVTQEPSSRSATADSGRSTRARRASRTSLSGWAERNVPTRLLLEPQELALIELLPRHRRMARRCEAAAREPRRRGLACEVEDRALAASRVLLVLLAG